MNRLWTRVFVIAAGILLLLFLSNDFGLIDIQKTAIVAAIGIDAAEEGGNVNVTAQIAVLRQNSIAHISKYTTAFTSLGRIDYLFIFAMTIVILFSLSEP